MVDGQDRQLYNDRTGGQLLTAVQSVLMAVSWSSQLNPSISWPPLTQMAKNSQLSPTQNYNVHYLFISHRRATCFCVVLCWVPWCRWWKRMGRRPWKHWPGGRTIWQSLCFNSSNSTLVVGQFENDNNVELRLK